MGSSRLLPPPPPPPHSRARVRISPRWAMGNGSPCSALSGRRATSATLEPLESLESGLLAAGLLLCTDRRATRAGIGRDFEGFRCRTVTADSL